MNKIFQKAIALSVIISVAFLMQGCLKENLPTDVGTQKQIDQASDPSSLLINGLNAIMVMHDSYGVSGNSWDWGYPCQMFIRDILGEDFPIASSAMDYYYSYIADGTYLNYFALYSFSYYYYLNYNAGLIIKDYGHKENPTQKDLNLTGVALVYRALAYMDLARMFEFKPTGFSIDDKASEVWGLTVPIVTENTTKDEAKHNPRAKFYTMYRFIMSDLNKAEKYLEGYSRTDKSSPDQSVVYGLKARLWLEMATRFDSTPQDLTAQLEHENDNDGYDAFGIKTAKDCYAQAAEYAKKAMGADGYSPLNKAEWYDTKTGFNTANHAWMWCASFGAKEQIGSMWYSWMCNMSVESTVFSWAAYWGSKDKAGGSRCISTSLFKKISDSDWRKKTWVAPKDAGARKVPAGYSTLLADNQWKYLDAYAGIKFHPGSGNTEDYNVGLLCDIPLMRVEEMYFIYAEAMAHSEGLAAGKEALENFMNAYRYSDNTYECNATSIKDFTDELMVQKRIEFWGEGLVYFDYKRLAKKITRYYDDSNFPSTYQLNSKEGYVAPWLNYYIYEYERDQNSSVILNPDPSNAVKAQVDY